MLKKIAGIACTAAEKALPLSTRNENNDSARDMIQNRPISPSEKQWQAACWSGSASGSVPEKSSR